MMVNIVIEDCNLEVIGYYSRAEPDVGLSASFEISEIYCDEDISSLIDWASHGNGFREIEEKIIEQIENNEPDYEDKD